MQRRASAAGLIPVALLLAGPAPPDALAAPPQAGQETQPLGEQGLDEQPLGRFHVGPFYVTPTLRIGRVALDTNVFYTPTDRTTDLTASIGPGLDVVLPVKGGFRLKGTGHLDYLYYAKTTPLRQFTGGGGGGFEWEGPRLALGAERIYRKRFERPDFEVDRRVTQESWQTNVTLDLKALDRGSRFGVSTGLLANRIEYAEDEDYLGADLRTNLNRDVYVAGLEVHYSLSEKTTAVAGGDYQWDRFLLDSSRDADSNRFYGGFEIESDTRLSGRAVGGVRLFRLQEAPAEPEISSPYASVALVYSISPKTQFQAGYGRDLNYSAFTVSEGPPIRRDERANLRFTKVLVAGLELRAFGRWTRYRTDGEVTVVDPEGESETAVRDDEIWEWGADLGYWFRSRLRLGVGAEYTRRSSAFSDLGFKGVLVGATVEYRPN